MDFDGIALWPVGGTLSEVKGGVERSYLSMNSWGKVQATRAVGMFGGFGGQFGSHVFQLEEVSIIFPLRLLLHLQNEQVSRKIILIGHVEYLSFLLQHKHI